MKIASALRQSRHAVAVVTHHCLPWCCQVPSPTRLHDNAHCIALTATLLLWVPFAAAAYVVNKSASGMRAMQHDMLQ